MNTALPDPPLLVTVGEAARLLGISESKAWGLIRRRDLEAVRVGTRSTRVIASALDEYVRGLRAAAMSGGSDTT